MTGVTPAVHGIHSNTTFDPLDRNAGGWYWYAEDIKAQTLWAAAAQAHLKTASVNWPVTVGDRNIQYLFPEYWRTSTPDDLKLMRPMARPAGILEQYEAALGPFVDGNNEEVAADSVRTRFTIKLIQDQRPDFLAVHLIALDGIEHHDGPFQKTAFETLEQLDVMIGQLRTAAIAANPATVVAVVSDHGFQATHTAVNLRSAFVDAGLIKLRQPLVPYAVPVIESWDAQVWSGAGVGAVVLRDRSDAGAKRKVEEVLAKVKADAHNGIARVLTRDELAKAGGYPEADWLVEFTPGFYLGSPTRGDLFVSSPLKGTHGYMPDRPQMHASFFALGKGIRQRELGVIDMRQIAPTFAHILNVTLPAAKQPALEIQ